MRKKSRKIFIVLALTAIAGVTAGVVCKRVKNKKRAVYAFDDGFDDEDTLIECTVHYENEDRASA